MKNRVVITGLGAVSTIGLGIEELNHSLMNVANGKSPVTLFDSSGFDHDYVCEVKGFTPENWIENLKIEDLGRSSQFAVSATQMALTDAGLLSEDIRGKNIASIFGTTDGESIPMELMGKQLYESGEVSFSPELFSKSQPINIAQNVTKEFGLSGESLVISTACAAGNYAIGTGFELIQDGEYDMVICGGSDSICRKTFAGFYRLGTMASENAQPFDLNREGILTGEGGAVLILESLSSADKRGAKIYAEVLGYAMTCDADHMVSPNRESIANCMKKALSNAEIEPEQVDYICMHGTGTKANDVTEVGAVKDVYGDNIPPVSSIKSSMGHSMGAASAFGAIACCLAMKNEFLPATINLETPDLDCDVDVVANEIRRSSPKIVQNDSFAFGGNNAIVILKKFEEQKG